MVYALQIMGFQFRMRIVKMFLTGGVERNVSSQLAGHRLGGRNTRIGRLCGSASVGGMTHPPETEGVKSRPALQGQFSTGLDSAAAS